jgi:hypothetical protein
MEGGNFMIPYVGSTPLKANRSQSGWPVYWRYPQRHDKESSAKGRKPWR